MLKDPEVVANKKKQAEFDEKQTSQGKKEEVKKYNGMTLEEHRQALKESDHKQYLHDSGMQRISDAAYSASVTRSHNHMKAIEELTKK